jgi:putative ABC transport system permease protein
VYRRRSEIGTLRALGFPRKMVKACFLVESSFDALLGILIGVATATLARYILYLQKSGDDIETFSIPALEIGALVTIVYLVARVSTILPAMRAASVDPVEALRPAE